MPHMTGHLFVDGKPKALYIGGRCKPARSGQTFVTHNPASGEELARR